MNKETIYVIVVCQEFKSANHRNLWSELSKYHRVVVVDIPADYVVSTIKRKRYRIKEAKRGAQRISESLYVVRPLLFIRHEFIPIVLKSYVSNVFWNSVAKCIPNYKNCRIKFLTYDGIWNRFLSFSGLDVVKGYYLYDEVRNNGNDNSINQNRFRNDEAACKDCDVIFTMTDVLTESRRVYNNHIITIGNGSVYEPDIKATIKIPNSVAFIGNFRNWIDNDLLEGLIKIRHDVIFAFAGSIENDMKSFFDHLMNNYDNVIYMGRYTKERMSSLYQNFDAVIIPYRHNKFIQATRPIKIVESIMSGTPVITVPMAGYKSSKYIRFADSIIDFSKQIDYLFDNPINKRSVEYRDFVKANSWELIASIIELELS